MANRLAVLGVAGAVGGEGGDRHRVWLAVKITALLCKGLFWWEHWVGLGGPLLYGLEIFGGVVKASYVVTASHSVCVYDPGVFDIYTSIACLNNRCRITHRGRRCQHVAPPRKQSTQMRPSHPA